MCKKTPYHTWSIVFNYRYAPSHLIKKIVNTFEMLSLKKSKRNMKFDRCSINSEMIQDIWRTKMKDKSVNLVQINLSVCGTCILLNYFSLHVPVKV